MRFFNLTVFLVLLASVLGFAKKTGFTQEDRERLIRLETTLKVFMQQVDRRFEQIDKRFEQVDKRISELREDMNKRFELVDKRFEQFRIDMNKRFEQFRDNVNARFEQIDKRFIELREDMNKRFEQINNELNRLIQIMIGIFAGQLGLVGAVIAFALWDRRTIIRKAREETVDYLEREGKLRNLIEALREKAKTDTELAKILRKYGLM